VAVLVYDAAVWVLRIDATFEITVPPGTSSPRVASTSAVVVAPLPFRGSDVPYENWARRRALAPCR